MVMVVCDPLDEIFSKVYDVLMLCVYLIPANLSTIGPINHT